MTYNFEGVIKVINPIQTWDSGFSKREIVLSSLGEKFEQLIKFEFIKELAEKLNDFKVGDNVKVVFTLRGNEYKGKYYTNLNAIAIGHLKDDGSIKPPSIESVVTKVEESGDDLPF